ncbi:MAG: hypothetical protein IT204_25850 [Fimbriimonadaceae bacterium]|nr:hypothetical protein [Fimbriimonadaceae bacterium]
MSITVYVEGGSTGQASAQLRIAFRQFLDRALPGQPPIRVIPCGGRAEAYRRFRLHVAHQASPAVLLVDAEELPVTAPWDHLRRQDGFRRPRGAPVGAAQ